VNGGTRPPAGSGERERQQGIAAAITEVSERASLLVREEIELAKTEITEKATRLAKGAIVAIVAGVFFFTALFFVLIGLAWLLYYELPIGNEFTYFWGFFAMALILVILGVIAGLLAFRAVKAGSPPMPEMAIEEARKIRETVSSSSQTPPFTATTEGPTPAVAAAQPQPVSQPQPPAKPVAETSTAPASAPQSGGPTSDTELGRGTVDGTTLGG